MQLDFEEVVVKFKETIADSHPGITVEQLQRICWFPFAYLYRLILDDSFPEMRMKYLGIFKVDVKHAQICLDRIVTHYSRLGEQNNLVAFKEQTEKLMKYIYNNRHDVFYQKYMKTSKKFPSSIIHQHYNMYD